MTAERDGKSRRTGQPDLLASLPDERPPASQPAPGIDPASIEELLTEVQDLRNEFAGLKEAVSAERLAPVTLEELREQLAGLRQLDSAERPAPVTPEALEAWDDKLVTRVAEAADTPGEDEVVARLGRIKEKLAELTATVRRLNAKLSSIGNERAAARTADTPGEDAAAARIERIEETAAKAESPAERIDGEPESTADRVAAEIKGMKNTDTRMDTGLATMRAQVIQQSRRADPILEVIKTRVAGPRFGLPMVLAGLIVLVFGMLIESRIHILYRWLWTG